MFQSVLVETQDKALRRISELREQCALEQSAKVFNVTKIYEIAFNLLMITSPHIPHTVSHSLTIIDLSELYACVKIGPSPKF